jgi:hypothetical protein
MDWDVGGKGYPLIKTAGTSLTGGFAGQLAPTWVSAVSPGAIDTWEMKNHDRRYWEEKTL